MNASTARDGRSIRAGRRRSIAGPFRILVFECYAGTYNELSHVARWMRRIANAHIRARVRDLDIYIRARTR